MHFNTFFTVALATTATAGSVSNMDISNGIGRRSHHHRRELPDTVSHMERRSPRPQKGPAPSKKAAPQLPNPASGAPSKSNIQQWNQKTAAACNKVMAQLQTASNPSGLGVCYNLPFLDKKSGVFQAELRVFNVTPPTAPWDGVSAGDISVAFSYQGATVQQAPSLSSRAVDNYQSKLVARLLEEIEENEQVEKRQQSSGAPPQIKVLSYVGQIDSQLLPMSDSVMQSRLRPNIGLSAKSPQTGQKLTTLLSSPDANFVNGVFAGTQTEKIAAAANSPLVATTTVAPAAILVNPKTFTVPGVTLGIFPTGLIITSIWAGFFILAVGLGTLGRIQFREQYRRRSGRANAANVRTI